MARAKLAGDPISLGGVEIGLLQFADDIAFVASSEDDLDTHLYFWETYCGASNQLASIENRSADCVSRRRFSSISQIWTSRALVAS